MIEGGENILFLKHEIEKFCMKIFEEVKLFDIKLDDDAIESLINSYPNQLLFLSRKYKFEVDEYGHVAGSLQTILDSLAGFAL